MMMLFAPTGQLSGVRVYALVFVQTRTHIGTAPTHQHKQTLSPSLLYIYIQTFALSGQVCASAVKLFQAPCDKNSILRPHNAPLPRTHTAYPSA